MLCTSRYVVTLTLLLACSLRSTPASGQEPPPAPIVCDEDALNPAKNVAPLSAVEATAICSPDYSGVFTNLSRMPCPGEPQLLSRARLDYCEKQLALGGLNPVDESSESAFAALRAALDLLTRRYRANGNPLADVLSAQSALSSDGTARAEAAGAVMLAQGIADFLVSRAEDETSVYAGEKMLSRLCKNYKVQFPVTCRLYEGAEQGVGLGALKRAMISDLRALPEVLLKALVEHLKVNAPAKTLACTIDVGYALAKGVDDRIPLGDLLKTESFGEHEQHIGLWAFRIKALDDLCATTWSALDKAVSDLLGDPRLRAVQSSLANATAKLGASGEPTNLQREVVIRAVFAYLRAALEVGGQGLDEAGTKAFAEVESMVVAIVVKDWVALVTAVATSDYVSKLLLCQLEKDESGTESCKVNTKLRAILTLASDVAQATTSEGVSAALERFAAPVGSWRAKFEGLQFSLNGYAGAKIAYENAAGDYRNGAAVGPLLSIGLEISGPIYDGGRLGLYAQVIDVGNVASVRFADKDSDKLLKVKTEPEVDFLQLFAPGAYLVYGPFRSPFVIGAGCNWVPKLRKADAGDKNVSVFQVGAFLAVDVTILGK